MAQKCSSDYKCHKCQGKHNISICLKNERTNVTVSSDSNTSSLSTISPNSNQTAGPEGNLNNSVALQTDFTAVNVNNCKNKVVLLQTSKACVCNLNETKKSTLRMLFDSGSRRTFLNENVKERLNLKSIGKEKLLINTLSEKTSFLKEFDIMKIKLKSIGDFIIDSVCIPSVCTPLSNQQCNKVDNVFPHFRNLKFADNINEQNKKIDLLIGADYYHKFFTGKIIRGKEGEPVAKKTFFGWEHFNF